jgi:hypothetical protein
MASPSLALQGSVASVLKAAGPVSALVGARVYDSVPTSPSFPYITLGEARPPCSTRAEAYEGDNVAFAVHAWSRGVGFPEAKTLAWAIKQRPAPRRRSTVPGYHA